MNWRIPDGSNDILMLGLGEVLKAAETSSPDLFPDLRGDQELVIPSDYSGEHQQSDYIVVAYILTNVSSLQSWDLERREIRQEFLPDGRRIAFKNLSDARRQKAFYTFLRAAGRLNGILLCMAIDKKVPRWKLAEAFLGQEGIKASVKEKMVNVFMYGAFLLAGLSRAGQTVRWITDDDEIVSNENTQQAACQAMGSMLYKYCTHGMGGAVLGIASKFDDDRRAEDPCALPDLIAGALSEFLMLAPEGTINDAGLHVPRATMYSTKTTMILAWLSTLKGPLKKVCCLVSPNEEGGRSYKFLNLSMWIATEGCGTIWTPPDKNWRKAMEGWGFGRCGI